MKALLKRYKIVSAQTVNIGHVALNGTTYECKIGDQVILLPLKEFELLFKLASYPFKTFTRDQLIHSIMGFIFFGVFVSIVSPFIRKKEIAFFNEMMDAIARISKGDFQVNINKNRGPLGPLVESINSMAVNLKEMEDMRQEFVSNVSHEIQSPLTSISGFARAMIYEELPRDSFTRS